MTNYLYVCPDGHQHEREYGLTDKRPQKITCHCKKLARSKICPPTVFFKGPGFYSSAK